MPFKKRKQNTPVRQARISSQDTLFRRSSTLTGSISSEVRAANEERSALKSDRLTKQELKRRQKKISAILVIVLCIVGGIYYLISQYIFTVDEVNYQNTVFSSQPPTQAYSQRISDYLKSNPGQRFAFALNNDELLGFVQEKYPEISAIDNSETNTFTVQMRKPIAVWTTGSNVQSFVDENGEAFARNYYGEPSVKVNDATGASVVNGSTVAGKSFLHFLGRTVALTNKSNVGTVKEATLPPNTTREIDIRLEGRGYLVKLHIDRDPAQEVEDLKRVDAYLQQKGIQPSYVDLRIPGKAYYK